jgi:hypothetical protein
MANLLGFNARDVEPSRPFDPIPAGQYLAVVTESELKKTKDGTGEFLELKFRIVDGAFTDRLVWARLNLKNPHPIAENYAKAELSAICRAVGVMAPGDSIELHDRPLVIHVRCKKRDDTGELTNEVAGYSKIEPGPASAIPDASSPPWQPSPPKASGATAAKPKHDVAPTSAGKRKSR